MSVIGIDLGGTKVSRMVFDNEGNCLREAVRLLERRKGVEAGQLVIDTFGELLLPADEAIDIRVPGISNTKTGRVWAPNIPGWESYPLQKEVEDMLGNPAIQVKIVGDRSCHILGKI